MILSGNALSFWNEPDLHHRAGCNASGLKGARRKCETIKSGPCEWPYLLILTVKIFTEGEFSDIKLMSEISKNS